MIIRTRRRSNFTILPNEVLQNHRLSWEARGMLAYLVSLPEGWLLRITELSKRSPAGYSKNRRILDELIAAGHIHRSQERNPDGTFGEWVYDVYDLPQSPDSGFPYPVIPNAGGAKLERNSERKEPLKKETVASSDGERCGRGSRKSNAKETQEEIENTIGFRFPESVSELGKPGRVGAILFRYKLSSAQARLALAEFDDFVTSVEVDDAWALLVEIARQAGEGKLKVSAGGEKRLPQWI